jgi:hypothetical protein
MENPKSWADEPSLNTDERERSARDPRTRERWDKTFKYLREQSKTGSPSGMATELLDALRRFESEMYPEQRALLATTLLWNEDEAGFVLWMQSVFRTAARAAGEALRRHAGADPQLGKSGCDLAGVALSAYGSAIKWAEAADSDRDPALVLELKRAYAFVESAAKGGERVVVPHGEFDADVTVTALFIRGMLLDVFCRGNLGPRQLEIADSWLWEWCGDFVLTTSSEGAVLAFDKVGASGLRSADMVSSGESGNVSYIAIGALARQIAAVVRGFRQGEIFPGYGSAAEFRVEEHVATLDFLRRFLDAARNRTEREARVGRDAKLEAFIGMGEIISKSFTLRKSPIAESPSRSQPSSQHLAAIEGRFDLPRRWVRMLDESADGLGIECDDSTVTPIEVGALVALQQDGEAQPIICEVVRRTSIGGEVAGAGQKTRLGLKVLSREPKKLQLLGRGSGRSLDAIYMPGSDSAGHLDTLLVSEIDFDRHGDLEARFDDRNFVLKMNRVRYHGRGWHLAGFEVSEEKAKQPEAGGLEFPPIK